MTNKKWNRSSSFSPEELGTLNTATNLAIQAVIEIFHSRFDVASFSDEQRAEAYQRLAGGVTKEIAEFAETLKK